MADHSIYSPSRLHRIMACPGSVRLIEANNIASKTSTYAQHGTMLHEYTEKYLKGLIADFNVLKAQLLTEPLYEKNDEYLVQDAVEYFADVVRTKSTHNILCNYESQVSLTSWGVPEVWGTLDASIIDLTAMHVDIFDWKFGSGVQVFAKENPQQMAYAAGAIGWPPKHPIYSITIHIVQPTFEHFDSWEINLDELYNWVHNDLATSICHSRLDPPIFNPGEEQCRFCEAAKAAKCDARHYEAQARAIKIFENAKLKAKLKPRQIQEFLNLFPLVEQVAKGYMVYIQEELERGSTEFDHYKLVRGRSIRKWKSEAAAIKWLSENTEIEDIFESKLISPSKCETLNKLLKKNINFHNLYEKPEGKIKLAKATDPRPAIEMTKSAVDVFKDIQFPDELE